MEQRKLIKLGNSSYAIALPKDWVDKSNLKKGDNVFIVPNSNGELILMSMLKTANDEKKISIDLEKKDVNIIRKEIAAAYVRGYNIFSLTGKKDREKVENIKKFLNNLLSLEIIEEKEDSILVKDFFSLEEINQENFIRRIDNNLRELFDLIIANIKKGFIKSQKIQDIEAIDFDINKFYFLSSRILFKGMDNPSILSTLKTDCMTLLNNWWLCFNLERIGDCLKNLAITLKTLELDGKQTKIILDLFNKIQKIYLETTESFYKKDKEFAIKVSKEGKEVANECEKLSKSDDIVIVKIVSKLKEIEEACYQNNKMTVYTKI